ncbi:MAG: hypothetical protein MUC91_03855 [Verrucomicrobia bacterium]|nr:hypothetical protein [Verrucomicrobiota bacterium]
MIVSYEKVLVDVLRYKYLCDEGFISPPAAQMRLPIQEDGFFRHLAKCIAEDTGISCDLAERGLVHAALQHGRLDRRFFEAVVSQLYA